MKRGKGKPFTKNDPRASKGRGAGRPKKTVTWKKAETALREAFPRILLMDEISLVKLLKSNPTGVEIVAAKYIKEYLPALVDRFLGKTPNVLTGKDGDPLIPEQKVPVLPMLDLSILTKKQLDKFIENTKNR